MLLASSCGVLRSRGDSYDCRNQKAMSQVCTVCSPLRDWDFERNRDVTPPARGLLPLPHVQFWETENSGRLDRSHRGRHRRDISCLVDASDLRTLNAFKTPPAWSTSAVPIFLQR